MVPASFHDFFLASAGAGAALVGLLFVAVSIAPERNVAADAPVGRQATAASAFTALFNAFFVSLIALIPGGAFGGGAAVFGALGLVNSVGLARMLLKRWYGWQSALRRGFLVVVGVIVYGAELYYGARLLQRSDELGSVYSLVALLVGIYGIGLTRAWQLLGARRNGILGWLSILHEEDGAAAAARPETGAARSAVPSARPKAPGR
jgi:hypothetical protein